MPGQVFTPGEDSVILPSGAVALDFAFAIHTSIGLRARGVKVNGKMSTLDHELAHGDVVEVLTSSKTMVIGQDSLRYVKTKKARYQIKKAFST